MSQSFHKFAGEQDKPWDRKHHMMIDKEPLPKSKVVNRLMRFNTFYRNKMERALIHMYKSADLQPGSHEKYEQNWQKLLANLVKIDYL